MPQPARPLLAIAFALLLLVGMAPAAAAFTATFPIQSFGDRGADVRAAQGLLLAHGLGGSIDGTFGIATQEAVKWFQATHGLTATGIVGAPTWSRLIVPLGTGSNGEAVKVVQRLLNEKRSAGLAVTGSYGTATRDAVATFQRHMGMTATGSVGSAMWRTLLWHYDYPSFGATLCDYSVGNGRANWGTGSAIGLLETAAAAFVMTGHGRVAVGDISLEHGGNIPLHATHEVGLDVDVRLIRIAGNQCTWGTNWRRSGYSRTATRALIKTIRAVAPRHVKLIYFNDPVLIREGLTTWHFGHDDHIHIRYCEPTYPVARYRC
jgi:peptidoglycan hydrolase-like protein with peptidoglycan-binding domain